MCLFSVTSSGGIERVNYCVDMDRTEDRLVRVVIGEPEKLKYVAFMRN